MGLLSPRASTLNRGSGTLVTGTVTIANTGVQANSNILLSGGALNASTALGILTVTAITPGVSFVITAVTAGAVSTQAGDLRTVYYSF